MPWADLSDARLYYELNGRGEAAVLLIPGLGATCDMWLSLLPDLNRHFLTVTIDNRGMGRSESRRPALKLHHFAADIVELLDYLELERVHVVGISLGGIIAQCLALEHRERVERLVLLSCAHRFGPYLSEMARFMGHALARFPRRQYARAMGLLSVGPRHLDADPEEFARHVEDECRHLAPRSALLRQLRALRDTNLGTQEYDIRCPTLVMSGECDRLIPACYARDMAREIPECEFVAVPDAGHSLVRECPQEVLSRVIPFLQCNPHWTPRGAGHHSMREATLSAVPQDRFGERIGAST